ncbi:MAG TPA: alpha-glucan family phosphorylase [Bryobacteraceae bacterium]|jgi:starch phosphorylase
MSYLRSTGPRSEAPSEDTLEQLALDLSWSWKHTAAELWKQLDPELWDLTHSPWVVFQAVSEQRLNQVASDPQFQDAAEELKRIRREERESRQWFQQAHPQSPLTSVAYFSMEYMLSEGLPIYSGGLGNVAGDQLKAANDLGVPVTAVGLLYDQGYFRQEIDRNGNQLALYPFNDPGQLPVQPVRDSNGEWLRLSIPFPGGRLWIRTWQVQVGRAKLYLLDTNDLANLPEYRSITSELYGGGPDLRLRQEHVLGIGGWQLLRALGIHPEVCHLNEGHAAFAVIERAASYKEDTGQPFSVAATVTRAGNLFTTHTPVEAGFDRFAPDLMWTHFGRYCEDRLGIPFDDFMALGRRNADDHQEPFNMAYLAIRGSGAVNGVSRLHGAVSRGLFQPLFPRWPTEEVPVRHVTNGVHTPTWDSKEAHSLWTEVCGKKCWHGDLDQVEQQIRRTADAPIWRMRNEARSSLIEYLRSRYSRQIAIQGGDPADIADAAHIFDPAALTLGFARRFATYKRPNMLLRDPERLLRLLRMSDRPVQLVLAGKAHPQDGAGQAMIRQWIEFIRRTGPHPPVIFLSDYDMLLTERLLGGVDVWINTPRRPWEASGTSGMKVLVNGGLNLSELDGWWAEAFTPEVGWAVGDGLDHGDDPAWDAAEAEMLYTLLENRIVPEFYERDSAGIPAKWIARVRESMARLTPEYSANRAVREYTENYYLPAANAYTARAHQNGRLGAELLEWQQSLASEWNSASFGPLTVRPEGDRLRFEVPVNLGSLNPDSIRVELFAGALGSELPVRQPMERGAAQSGGGPLYSCLVENGRPPGHFTPRLVPYHPSVSVPLEARQILWQK